MMILIDRNKGTLTLGGVSYILTHLRNDSILILVKTFHEKVWRPKNLEEVFFGKVPIISCKSNNPEQEIIQCMPPSFLSLYPTCWSPPC